MIVKMTNKSENFYKYMGKCFGSRLIQKQINDRIFDDDNKIWYIFIENEKVIAFVSLNENVIKNVYSTRDICLEEILKEVLKDIKVTYSIVSSNYIKIYEKCGFKVCKDKTYKNFVTIYLK